MNTYFKPFDYRLRDFTRGYRFHRRLGLVTSTNPDEDAPLGRWKSLKRARRDFLYRGPRLRRDDRIKYG
jgi:hypothetical protein